MFERKRGDYLLPMIFFERDVRVHFRGVIINITPEGITVVSNDHHILDIDSKILMDKEFFLEFNFFSMDTEKITGVINKVRPGLFKGHEITMEFTFTDIDFITKRDINRTLQAQRL